MFMKYTTNIFGLDSSVIVFIAIGLDIIKNCTWLIYFVISGILFGLFQLLELRFLFEASRSNRKGIDIMSKQSGGRTKGSIA